MASNLQVKGISIHGIPIHTISGHFATNHSHINCYVDMTEVKIRHKTAQQAAAFLARGYALTNVDTIICQEGTEMIGAFMANTLSGFGMASMNGGMDICVLTPELNTSSQLMFRENTLHMVKGKSVLLLLSTISTGNTANHAINCIQYYEGHLAGICALFSIKSEIAGIQVNKIFTKDDIADYQIYSPDKCELCAAKQPIDAIVNGFGYSKL